MMPTPTALKVAIVYSGLAQITIAKRADIHESRLSKIVRGHSDATESEKKRLARVLRLSVDQLFPDSDAGSDNEETAVPA